MRLDKNVHFITSDFSPAFKEFGEWKIVGFDLEEYWGKSLCLIQISTPINAYLFDPIALGNSEEFKMCLKELFEDRHVKKLGFSCRPDVKQIGKFIGFGTDNFSNVEDL